MSGYVTAFRRCANRVADLQDAEALDRFVRGLNPVLRKDVLLRDPHTCEEAMTAVKRIGAIHNYVTGKHSFVPRQNQGIQRGRAYGSGAHDTHGLGYAPMDLDMLEASDNATVPSRRQNRGHNANRHLTQ